MAPIFYCKCFNCLCTATVLLTDQDKTEDAALIVTPSDEKNKRTPFVEDVVTNISNKTAFRISETEDSFDVASSDGPTNSYMERNQHKLESLFSLLIIILILICRSSFQTPTILFRDSNAILMTLNYF